MICDKCNQEIIEKEKLCLKCGSDLTSIDEKEIKFKKYLSFALKIMKWVLLITPTALFIFSLVLIIFGKNERFQNIIFDESLTEVILSIVLIILYGLISIIVSSINKEIRIQNKLSNFPLINLSGNLFYLVFEILLWLIIISGSVLGGIKGSDIVNTIFVNNNDKLLIALGIILGVMAGVIVSVILITIIGGLISLYIKKCSDINEIKLKIDFTSPNTR